MPRNSLAQAYAERGEFARALAHTHPQSGDKLEIWQPWAYFKLVMYETAASLDIDLSRPESAEHQLLPCVVSNAAIGKHARARNQLNAAPWDCLPNALRIATAKYLSIYMPQDAYQLLDGLDELVPPAAHISVMLRAGQKELARCLLRQLLDNKTVYDDSRLYLYKTIIDVIPPIQQLDCLNRVYTAAGFPVLALKDRQKPLSPCNVHCAGPLSCIDGPLVSVIMTTYNVAERVSAAIESILQQSYRQLELIVVDDASTDDTISEIIELSRQDSRVRLIRLDHNVGTYCAKSVGLKYANGDFLTCMDADDWSHPLKLALQIKPLLDDDSLVASTSNCIRISDFGVVDARPSVHLEHLNYSSLLFRREKIIFEIGGWDPCARTAADTEFIWRISLVYGHRTIKNIPGILSLVSHRDDSLTMANDGTGFVDNKFPTEILKYIESFNLWHIEKIRSGQVPMVDRNLLNWVDNHPFIFQSSAFSDTQCVKDVLDSSYEVCN